MDNVLAKAAALEARAHTAESEAEKIRLDLEATIASVRDMQSQAEKELRAIFAPRSVQIVGEINTI